MTEDKPLPAPLRLSLHGKGHTVTTVREAYDFLTTHWPEDARGSRYDEAAGACLKVLDGHRSAVDAADALRAAAEEAGISLQE